MSRKSSSSSSTVTRVAGPELDRAIYLDLLHKMLTVDAIEERLNMIQSHVRQATDSLRRRAKYYAKPTWTDRLSAYLSKN